MTEKWRPVVGSNGYEVSSLGRVRSLDRIIATSNGRYVRRRGQMLKPVPVGGYHQVTVGGRNDTIHTLVMEAFVGPRPEGLETCHGNGEGTDNRLGNLRYGTRSDNVLDRVRHGTHHNVNKTHCPRAHEYTPANTVVRKGSRFCRACAADFQRLRRARQRTTQLQESA